MTNTLVGDVYQKIIEDVVASSKEDFATSGVPDDYLLELQQEWHVKLSARGVAQMPWDPKPEPPAPVVHAPPPTNGLPPSAYANYDAQPANGARVKGDSVPDHQYNGISNGYPPQPGPPQQGGAARAAQLMQQQYGAAASASLNSMQRGGGLALPGQPQQARPQGLQLPGQPAAGQQQAQQQYAMQQQQQAALQQRQHHQQMQQQAQQQQPRIKMESNSPQLAQGAFQPLPNYSQTDGADDAHEQWQNMLAQRRAMNAEQGQQADSMMRDLVAQGSADYQSGLMLPLAELPSNKRQRRAVIPSSSRSVAISSSIPQLDGVADDVKKEEEKDDDDENAINSDLDDPDDDQGIIGDDNDEELDTILCTYDKVQRVKNKWKCTLKDGVMSVGGKEWVFFKGTGEFEW